MTVTNRDRAKWAAEALQNSKTPPAPITKIVAGPSLRPDALVRPREQQLPTIMTAPALRTEARAHLSSMSYCHFNTQ